MTAFWIVAPIVVIGALGLILARKAVHAALSLAVVMLGLAVLYAANGAPFLFAVQIIVYTGAIMMLFLFVVMLVGVESGPFAVTDTIPGQKLAAALVGIGFAAMFVIGVAQVVASDFSNPVAAVSEENVEGLAALMFGPYMLAFQFTAALLVTAVLGAMVLAHRERLTPRVTQAELAQQRVRDFAERGVHPGNAATPGVYARHNAADVPALLPDGTPLESSVPDALVRRGQVMPPPAGERVKALDEDAAEREYAGDADNTPKFAAEEASPGGGSGPGADGDRPGGDDGGADEGAQHE